MKVDVSLDDNNTILYETHKKILKKNDIIEETNKTKQVE